MEKMTTKEEMNEIVLREKEKSLHISRLPRELKEQFVKFAEEEFADDFGMCLKFLFDQAMEYQYMKNALFNGYLTKDTEQSTASQEEKPEKKVIKFLSGKKVEREVKNNE
jgi:hypothetical protein